MNIPTPNCSNAFKPNGTGEATGRAARILPTLNGKPVDWMEKVSDEVSARSPELAAAENIEHPTSNTERRTRKSARRGKRNSG